MKEDVNEKGESDFSMFLGYHINHDKEHHKVRDQLHSIRQSAQYILMVLWGTSTNIEGCNRQDTQESEMRHYHYKHEVEGERVRQHMVQP